MVTRARPYTTSPDPCQFCSLAIDPSGEVVCAGELTPHDCLPIGFRVPPGPLPPTETTPCAG